MICLNIFGDSINKSLKSEEKNTKKWPGSNVQTGKNLWQFIPGIPCQT